MIGGAGWAVMAWRLAISRVPHASRSVRYSIGRTAVEQSPAGCFPVHREYYRIVDSAACAWRNRAAIDALAPGLPIKL